ncbi:MAG: adenine phosphoribosyltransferase [Candidatus Marsarchaeota archaeon]|nr:adenine phosphoribosyltransferase [Candidatus Marsarchaeota archaeon]MCL5094955.1 adenine phosphoribosyltransferase [Candidatus Marsarchaeota archaeon]
MEKLNFEDLLKTKIRDIKDYPKKGIVFRDITPVLKDNNLFRSCIDYININIFDKKIDYIAGIDARGFIIGSILSYKLNKGFIPIRKKGKLPYKTISLSYDLEYSTETIEIHEDAIEKNSSVLIIDDVLATGGTVRASIDLLEKLDAKIAGICVLIELTDLNAREKLKGYDVFSIVKY